MRPETVHLIATSTRHIRGILNAVEKFERTIPRDQRAKEVAEFIEFVRVAMATAEQTLTAAPTP